MPSKPSAVSAIDSPPTAADVRFLPATIKTRTVLTATSVVGAALVVSTVFLVTNVHHRLVSGQRDAARLRARDIVTLAVSGQLPAYLSIPGEEKGFIQVVDRTGHVVSRSQNVAGEAPIIPAALRKLDQWSGIRTGMPIGEGERFILVTNTASTSNGRVTVITAESLESVDSAAMSLAQLLVIGIPLLTALVAIVTRYSVGRAFRPVGDMTRELAEIESMHLHRRVPQPTADDEIAELARTMNTMLDRLEQSSERQRRFVADASHELRSPLTSIRTALEVADAHPDRVDPREAIRDALADHDRMDALVTDLLTLARLDETGARSDTTLVDLAALVGADRESRPSGTIRWTSDLRPAVVEGHELRLQRVIRNLVDNAVRHARTTVAISTGTSATAAFLRIQDDGSGIAADDRDHVFERFTRLDDARATDDGGSGLGLAIVKETVQAHGGTVHVIDGPLSGALFEIWLPLRCVKGPGAT